MATAAPRRGSRHRRGLAPRKIADEAPRLELRGHRADGRRPKSSPRCKGGGAPDPQKTAMIAYRHRLPTRLWHWMNALTVFVMLMSGLMMFNAHPHLYWGEFGANFDDPWLSFTAGRFRAGRRSPRPTISRPRGAGTSPSHGCWWSRLIALPARELPQPSRPPRPLHRWRGDARATSGTTSSNMRGCDFPRATRRSATTSFRN